LPSQLQFAADEGASSWENNGMPNIRPGVQQLIADKQHSSACGWACPWRTPTPTRAYFQVSRNPGRKEQGTGKINYRNVLAHIHGRGYSGTIDAQHGCASPTRKASGG
jgi:hypothetical protein